MDESNFKKSILFFGKAFYFMFKAIQYEFKRISGIGLNVVRNYPIICLGCVISLFLVIHIVSVGKERISRDLFMIRIQHDKERIERLKYDSIALRSLSSKGVKHDTVYVIKNIKVIRKIKSDSI